MWDEITYPFPNFNGCTVEVWEWIGNLKILVHLFQTILISQILDSLDQSDINFQVSGMPPELTLTDIIV